MAGAAVAAPGPCPKEGECPADRQASSPQPAGALGRTGRGEGQEGLSPWLYQQTQPGSPPRPAAPSLRAHTGPRACPRPHATQGPVEDMVKVSGAAAGAQGRGCRNS